MASGITVRADTLRIRGLNLKNVKATPLKPDARPATVIIDVGDLTPRDFSIGESGAK